LRRAHFSALPAFCGARIVKIARQHTFEQAHER
jgi:hypothetical protein